MPGISGRSRSSAAAQALGNLGNLAAGLKGSGSKLNSFVEEGAYWLQGARRHTFRMFLGPRRSFAARQVEKTSRSRALCPRLCSFRGYLGFSDGLGVGVSFWVKSFGCPGGHDASITEFVWADDVVASGDRAGMVRVNWQQAGELPKRLIKFLHQQLLAVNTREGTLNP